MTRRSNSLLLQAHSPRYFLHHRLRVPIGMARAKMVFQPQSHRTVGRKDHGYPLHRSLPTQDLHDRLVEKFNARSLFRSTRFRG